MMAGNPRPATEKRLDLVCMGRAAVDLYGEQIGGRLEDMQSFAKYLGGSPANTSVGASRLGLSAAMLTRVGDEHNGRFVRETLAREGVDVSQVRTDPVRLTALVFLGILDPDTFPLVFYREHCADMGLCADDVDTAFIGSARALLVSGTHLSQPSTRQACLAAMRAAREAGTRVVLDIDYRPVLWGLTAPGLGEKRYVASDDVSHQLQAVLPLCDLVVGTEEEVHIAGGSSASLAALKRIREVTPALIVMKRGPMGCTAYPGPIPARIDGGVHGPGFPVDVFNVLGAGDAFMAGLLRGWVRDEPLADALRYANACGAIVVSRHGCAPAMPSWTELSHFLAHGSPLRKLREDADLEHLHRATTRQRRWPALAVLAFDHRAQFEALAAQHGVARERIDAFKGLVAQAASLGYDAERATATDPTTFPLPGILVDGRYGPAVLSGLAGSGCWIGRPVELPGSRPLAFDDGPNIDQTLRSWPVDHVVKCLVSHHPDDEAGLAENQLASLERLAAACHASGHELLLELIPPNGVPSPPGRAAPLARALTQVYARGVRPDWWKLPPPADAAAWRALAAVITDHDPHCRGVLLLGLEASEDALRQSFEAAARQPLCKGFAVGRSIFADAAAAWFGGTLDDAGVVADVADRYRRLIRLWCDARTAALPSPSAPFKETST